MGAGRSRELFVSINISSLLDFPRLSTNALPDGRATAPVFANLTSHAYFRDIGRVVTPIRDIIFLQPLDRNLLKCASFEFVPGLVNAHLMDRILEPSKSAGSLDPSQQILAHLAILECQTEVLHYLVLMNIKLIGKLRKRFRVFEHFTRFQDRLTLPIRIFGDEVIVFS